MTRTHVILAGFYPPPFAGEPIHVKQLSRFLRDRGLDVDILNLNRHAPPSHEYLNATTPWGLMARLFGLPERTSILHLHTNGHSWKSWLMILTAALAARLKGVRVILTIHSGLFPGYVAGFDRVRCSVARWTLGAFARVIGVNDDIGHALRRIGIDETRLAIIPAFLGVGQSTEVSPEDRARIDGGRPLLVAVGGGDKDPEMGLPTVIAILPELFRLFPDMRAVFLGWQVGPKTIPLIQSNGLSPRAICLGEVSHERCVPLLQEADVVVRSTFADGDAITVREALDLGVPVVASDTAFRPPGVVLFRKGDSADLLAKLSQVLASPEPRSGATVGAAQSAHDLWQIYSDLDPGSRAYVTRPAPESRTR
jgi:glycosyltransferase involved in cell wall biosynthesis